MNSTRVPMARTPAHPLAEHHSERRSPASGTSAFVSHVLAERIKQRFPLFMEEPGASIWLRRVRITAQRAPPGRRSKNSSPSVRLSVLEKNYVGQQPIPLDLRRPNMQHSS